MMGLFSFSNKPPGQDQFARMVLNVVRQAGEKGKIIYDRGQFRLRIRKGWQRGLRNGRGNSYLLPIL